MRGDHVAGGAAVDHTYIDRSARAMIRELQDALDLFGELGNRTDAVLRVRARVRGATLDVHLVREYTLAAGFRGAARDARLGHQHSIRGLHLLLDEWQAAMRSDFFIACDH